MKRVRELDVTAIARSIHVETVSCQSRSGANEQVQCTTRYDNEFSVQYDDKYQTLDAIIRFMDLRNDIVVYRTHEESAEQSVKSSDGVAWNQYGVIVQLNKVKPGDMKVDITEKDMIGETVIDVQESIAIAENPYTLAFPIVMGTPQANTNDDFYLWTEHREESGGLDLYYPIWLQGIGINNDLDMADKETHLGITNDDPFPSQSDLIIPPTILTECDDKGTWAVDKDGNRFYSMKTLTGVFNELTGGDPVILAELEGSNPVFYPIAPV